MLFIVTILYPAMRTAVHKFMPTVLASASVPDHLSEDMRRRLQVTALLLCMRVK